MLLAICAFAMSSLPTDPEAIYAQIQADYRSERVGFLRESIGRGSKPEQVAFNWTLGVMLSVENALAELNPKRIPQLKKTLEMTESYWNPAGPVPGYDVLPGPPHPNDRYYDDNAWMVMALVESYEITKDRRWLRRAEAALTHVLSGEDPKLGGGIFWREREKTSKNTCSNGPSAAACLAIYAHRKKPDLLAKAKSLYAWTRAGLRDSADGLYFDNLDLSGKLERTKWSYNTALMLRTARELARITKEPVYAADVREMEAASAKRWITPDFRIDDELPFAHLLFENLDLQKIPAEALTKKLLDSRNAEGQFGSRWGSPAVAGEHKLLVQVSAVRALAVYALHRRVK